MTGHGSKFHPKQEAAIIALLETGSLDATAKQLNIGVSTLARWMKREEFQASYQAARQRAFEAGLSRLHTLTGQAVETLRRNLTCGRPSVEIRAAGVILEHAQGTAILLNLQERMTRLEAKTKEQG